MSNFKAYIYQPLNFETFGSDLRQVGGRSSGTPVSSINKTDRHDITEILLKVALNTITIRNVTEIIV
jgi:hypothetical protein